LQNGKKKRTTRIKDLNIGTSKEYFKLIIAKQICERSLFDKVLI